MVQGCSARAFLHLHCLCWAMQMLPHCTGPVTAVLKAACLDAGLGEGERCVFFMYVGVSLAPL